jgi:hypothetical protein
VNPETPLGKLYEEALIARERLLQVLQKLEYEARAQSRFEVSRDAAAAFKAVATCGMDPIARSLSDY